MASQTYISFLPFVIIFFFSFISCSFHDEYNSYVRSVNDLLFRNSISLANFAALSAKTFDVNSFGARGDGKTDDTQAFERAWNGACSSTTSAVFRASNNKIYHVKPIRFQGPCKASLTMQISGTILASKQRSDYSNDKKHWLTVASVDNLLLQGGGVIDGNGDIWWKNSCKTNKTLPCMDAPTAFRFYKSNNLTVNNLTVQNAQQIHVSFEECVNVKVSNIQVIAPEESPNTDGIHITRTQNIKITDSVIGTGDDCISIVSGSKVVQATGITCGPGHGISIGSLGSRHSEADVSDVTIDGANISKTENGVRIKTWQGGSGSANKLKFQNINMDNVKNPIIIDQNYCDQDEPCEEQESAVQIKNVVYHNIKGTSATKDAITFNCSKKYPCQGVVLQEINITQDNGGDGHAVCNNVKLAYVGRVIPRCPPRILFRAQEPYTKSHYSVA